MATYITGAAMMEPDVRIETNRLGFCSHHFNQILARGSRLSVALILESLLAQVKGQVFPGDKTPAKKIVAAVHSRGENCFICENIDQNMRHLLDSTITLWQAEQEFRDIYAAQPFICLPHYGLVLEAAQKMPKKIFSPSRPLPPNWLPPTWKSWAAMSPISAGCSTTATRAETGEIPGTLSNGPSPGSPAGSPLPSRTLTRKTGERRVHPRQL